MMTRDEFQRQYHDFRTPSFHEAMEALRAVQCEEPVSVVKIGGEYCLMLKTAAEYIARLGIASEVRGA